MLVACGLEQVTSSHVGFYFCLTNTQEQLPNVVLVKNVIDFCRTRIETVLLKSNVLSEVQRSMLDGGMRVEDLPIDPLPRSGSLLPRLGQSRPLTDSQESLKEAYAGIGGPAGLWHFIYRSIYLDQYVASEFSPPFNTLRQQKR